MTKHDELAAAIEATLADKVKLTVTPQQELALDCLVSEVKPILQQLKTNPVFAFDQLIDLCGVDYLHYGISEWDTDSVTETGFSRGRESIGAKPATLPRFAVVYHLLSTTLNHRLRVKVALSEDNLAIPSVHDIWKGADWFEREAYDLYGILFSDHPDLRRLLTDYGFIGHPFRKDFPISGTVEMRYDATAQKVIYEPVDIKPRVGVPKVIRHDNRYVNRLESHD